MKNSLKVPYLPGFPFHFLQRGMMRRSYRASVISMAVTKKTVREPAGIWKAPNDLSMVDACSTEKVIIWAYAVQKIMVVAHIGSSLIIIFTSSTLVTEQSFQGLGAEFTDFSKSPSAKIAALSRKLSESKTN